jgi:putative intracellular protease/amidase
MLGPAGCTDYGRVGMTQIAYLVTSAREMILADGTVHPTGYFVEEALKPYDRFLDAGFDVTVITPDGQPPYADPYGRSWFFHYPDEDRDYLASVVRTFAHDVDDIRLTLHQDTELGLAAARRVAALLQAEGHSAAQAHRIVSAAAKTAWRQDRQFADVLAQDGSHQLTTVPQAASHPRLPASGRAVLADRRGHGRLRRGFRAGRARADGRPDRQP